MVEEYMLLLANNQNIVCEKVRGSVGFIAHDKQMYSAQPADALFGYCRRIYSNKGIFVHKACMQFMKKYSILI